MTARLSDDCFVLDKDRLPHREALAIRRGLVNSVPDNALYLGDVATSLQHIGELYLARPDLKGGLAFYEAAVDVRLQVTLLSPNDGRARCASG